MTRDVLAAAVKGDTDIALSALARPLYFVAEDALAHQLLREFLRQRTHLFAVVGPDGKVTGIVTLEDVLESLIGLEIVDETDVVVNMQTLARDTPNQPSEDSD